MEHRTLSPEEWIFKKKQYKYLLVVKGWLQKDIAKEIGVSQKTLSKWKKEMNIGATWAKVADTGKIEKNMANIPAYIAMLKLEFPEIYKQSQEAFKSFMRPF
jgi:DNA-binding XRE family transcriptional regulator